MPTTRSGKSVQTTPSTEDSGERTESTSTNPTTSTEPTVTEEALVQASEKITIAKSTTSSCTKKREKALRIARAKEDLLKLQVKLAAARLASLELEHHSDDEDSIEADGDAASRVVQWLDDTPPADTQAAAVPPVSATTPHEERPVLQSQPQPQTVSRESPQKSEEVTSQPAQQVNLSELASAIALAARGGATRMIELPTFGGSHQDWLSFKITYEESAKSYTEIENVARLRRALIGRAKEAVNNLLLYNAKTEDILKSLEARFGRPDCIALTEVERLRALPRLTDNPRDICIFASHVTNIVATLRALNKRHYLYNPEAVKNTIEKLTPVLRYRWYDYAAEREHKNIETDLEKLASFLNQEAERCGPYAQPENISDSPASGNRRQRTYNTSDRREKCIVCSEEGHHLDTCKKFSKASIEERWDIAKEKKLCFSCLRYRGKNHHCKRKQCSIDGCEYWHHRLLHYKKQTSSTAKEMVTSTWTTGSTAYLKIVPVHISGPVGGVDTYALLDDGSTVTLIDEEIANRTGVTGPSAPLRIEAIGENAISSTSRRVKINIKGSSEKSFHIRARTIRNLNISPQAVTSRDLEGCRHLAKIEHQLKYEQAKPRVLIGQDNWQLLLARETVKGQKHQPVASYTPLGWVLHGARDYGTRRAHRCNFITSSEEDMNEQLREYFSVESLLIQPKQPSNTQESQALRQLQDGVKKTDDGYEAPLLWKNTDVALPDNYDNTWKRLRNIEKKLDRDPLLKQKYSEQMDALLTKGYAEPAPPQKSDRTWYLPHFAVVNPMKPEKIRIVHDAAAKTKGVSLNDNLLKGPDLIQSLPGVLMRFRQNRIAVTADIKEMFMQVKIKSEDRDAVRYLWRGDRRDDQPPNEYRMTSLIFGSTCSPAIAIYVKNLNAQQHQHSSPREYDAIVRNHYVDDFLNSYRTEEEAIASARRIQQIHREAKYELRQWVSNSEAVSNALAPGSAQLDVTLNVDKSSERVLGVVWRPQEDSIGFNLNLARLPPDVMDAQKPTKRETLRVLMSLFDPLGLASPVTIRAKQILQEIWRRGTDWDEEIDEDLSTQWVTWITHLKRLRDVRIPRCYEHYSDALSLQLHVFVDASESAYSAVAYWRVTTAAGDVHLSLVAAKSKVSPLKMTSIPRLELQAAVMGSRLGCRIVEEHDKKPETTTYWTDSKTVLTWLKTGSRSYKPFVAHRVAAIEENSNLSNWRWIPTKLNVADDATRDVPDDFDSTHRWYMGPSFLLEDPTAWPSERPPLETHTGEERVHHARLIDSSVKEVIPDPQLFSKWERLLRSTARVLQFIDLCRTRRLTVQYRRQKKNKQRDPTWDNRRKHTTSHKKPVQVQRSRKYIDIDVKYLRRAEELIVRASQSDSFGDELHKIEDFKKGKLRALSVEIIDGIVKIKSRIEAAHDIDTETRHPPILSGDHHIARLYIEYIHRRLHHAGIEPTINECRTKYWITRIRTVARMIIHRCVPCRIRRKSPPEPSTGNLPHCRLAHHHRPFTFTGVDYFGPVTVTVGRGVQKRYVALFTCLTTRAVHLEIAPSLTTSSAVMALRRFIARRGCPTEVWSDNGTNLRGADKELRQAIDEATSREATTRAISWRYIPPGAPFMGGAWERLVRSVKTALNATLTGRHPSEEVLATLLAEVEFTVNNRPLTHVSVDPDDPEALTPNHFLLQGPALHPAPGTFDDSDLIHRGHWRAAQRLADVFWERWVKEYLPDLQQRRQPHGRGDPVTEGDVVLIVDNTLPRNMWPMGRVIATYPGSDGIVRTVDIKTKGGVLRRPVKKLIVIVKEDRPSTSA